MSEAEREMWRQLALAGRLAIETRYQKFLAESK